MFKDIGFLLIQNDLVNQILPDSDSTKNYVLENCASKSLRNIIENLKYGVFKHRLNYSIKMAAIYCIFIWSVLDVLSAILCSKENAHCSVSKKRKKDLTTAKLSTIICNEKNKSCSFPKCSKFFQIFI